MYGQPGMNGMPQGMYGQPGMVPQQGGYPQGQMNNMQPYTAPVIDIEDKTVTVNGHTYQTKKDLGGLLVTFSNVPSDFAEFSQVYNDFLGKNEFSVVAMIPMLLEMYARDKEQGVKCLELACTPACKDEMIRVLDERFYGEAAQRYQPAAMLMGAKCDNAYEPKSPYIVRVDRTPKADETSDLIGGTFCNRFIIGEGWDAPQRSVIVFKGKDKSLFQLNNCNDAMAPCKPINGEWAGLA
jgi:hypothetical protein